MKFVSYIFFSFALAACGGGGGDGGSNPVINQTTGLQCDLAVNYTPRSTAVLSSAVGVPVATAIVLHGKTGSPLGNHMISMQQNLNGLGYDVIMPYMTWSTLNWDGTLCDSISYLNVLIKAEKNAGKKVILVGHSLGGPGVLAYASLANTIKPDLVIPVAPGHYIHQSSKLAMAHADSIARAKTMIDAGQGNQINIFQTLNGGVVQNISCTAVTYLSMHDVKQYPDLKVSTAAVAIPLLWLAGTEDPLTATSNKFGFKNFIPNSNSNLYKEIKGTHKGIMIELNTAMEIDNWFKGL